MTYILSQKSKGKSQKAKDKIQNSKIQKFKIIPLIFCFAYFVLNFLFAGKVSAQSFSLVPATASKSAGLEFTVDLNIDTGGQKVTAADVKMSFDPNILQIVSIQEGTFFTETSSNIYTGTLYVGGSFLNVGQTASGTGKLATLKLKGKTAGIGLLSFVCTAGKTDETNIFDNAATAKDIVSCALLKNGSYTINGVALSGVGDVAVSTTVTPTPEPPVTGISLPTIFFFGIGTLLLILGLVFVF